MKTMLLCLLLAGPWAPTTQQDAKPHRAERKSDQDSKPVPPAPVFVDHDASETRTPQAKAENGASQPDKVSVPWWHMAEWVAVAVNVVYVAVSICMWWVIRRQANIAVAGTQAMMDAEKGVIVLDKNPTWYGRPQFPGRPPMEKTARFVWRIRNSGKSPVFIRGVFQRFVMIESFADLPKSPAYAGDTGDLPVTVLVADQESPYFSVMMGEEPPIHEVIRECEAGRRFLYAYTLIVYTDVFNRPHTSQLGQRFHWKSNSFETDGPAAYNQYT
jgi:hypothetical protein